MKGAELGLILVLGIFFQVNAQVTRGQTADVIFETNSVSAPSFNDHEFTVKFSNTTTNKQVCQSGNCSIEIIKSGEVGLPTGIVIEPKPDTQNMNSGVDIRITDPANAGMSGTEREFQERWNIWGNCGIKEIDKTVFICGNETFDTITLSNKIQDIELRLPLTKGTYDSATDKMVFEANFKNGN